MITERQEAALLSIDRQCEELETNFQQVQALIGELPDIEALRATLTNIELPDRDIVLTQLTQQLLAPLVEPLQQLQDAGNTLLAIPEKITDKLAAIQDDLESLTTTPEAIRALFTESHAQVDKALDYLIDQVGDELVPQWSEVIRTFEDIGEDSLDDFEQAIRASLSNMSETLRQTVQDAFERQFTAITAVQTDTQGLLENTTKLAENIQGICKTLADAEVILSEETSRANIGVNKTIEAINDIESAIKSTLPI